MRSGGASAHVSSFPSSLVAFKPRQVILLEHNRTNSVRLKSMENNQSGDAAPEKSERDLILSYSVAQWLERMGFSKVLKRFLSAAKIQDDEWKAKALNLNDIFSKFMEMNAGVCKDLDPEKPEDGDEKHKASFDVKNLTLKNKKKDDKLTDDGTAKAEDHPVEKQIEKKKKKSKSLDVEENKIDSKPEPPEEKQEGLISDGSRKRRDHVISDESKHKNKKKLLKKDNPINADRNLDLDNKENYVHLEDNREFEKKKMKKGKKRKEEEPTPTGLAHAVEIKDDESTKTSKKRKRKAPDENESQSAQEDAGEESKPKKIKSLEESKVVQQPQQNGHCLNPNKEENLLDERKDSHKLSAEKQKTEKTFSNNAVNKAAKKPHKNSAEPKSASVFQRVKVHEVEFVDDQLQDNSYWAKDGADIGYGAKAQEVLGQVKGRDFRHEKTKKKRGSYRGGQINLQSHSVKFNYSDDDE